MILAVFSALLLLHLFIFYLFHAGGVDVFFVVGGGARQQQIPVRFVEERFEAAPTTESWAKLGNAFKVGRASHYKG